jgi:septum formation protein
VPSSSNTLVLASSSPRRRELLTLLGHRFDVLPADLDESVLADEEARAYVERLARAKASAVAAVRPDAVIVAADTTVVLDGEIFGKPIDARDGARMLRLLSDRTHDVHTGIAVIDRAGGGGATTAITSIVVTTEVTFDRLTDADVAFYVSTGEPLDKAGAYAIQGIGAMYVRSVRGSVTNVVGLPLSELRALLGDVMRTRPD